MRWAVLRFYCLSFALTRIFVLNTPMRFMYDDEFRTIQTVLYTHLYVKFGKKDAFTSHRLLYSVLNISCISSQFPWSIWNCSTCTIRRRVVNKCQFALSHTQEIFCFKFYFCPCVQFLTNFVNFDFSTSVFIFFLLHFCV